MGPVFKKEVAGSNANLIYKATKDDVIDSISLRMLLNNQIKGISELTHKQKNNENYFIFDISHKSTIRELLESPIDEKKLLDVLTGILTVISSAEEYILESSRFVFDLDYIFVDVSTFETQMIYLPVDTYKKTEVDIAEFFKNLINVAFNPSESYDYMHQIMIFLNRQTSPLPQDFNTMLKEMLKELDPPVEILPDNTEGIDDNPPVKTSHNKAGKALISIFGRFFGRNRTLETEGEEAEDTIVIDPEEDKQGNSYPYLIRLNNNHRIPINKSTFIIGREKNNDYCISDSRFVGRKHASILFKGSSYYIVDANTVNHTYVNNNKIPGGVETKIEHGEKITIANEEFEFNIY